MLAILKQCVLRLFRSPSSIFFVLIFPSLLIFVLGNMLANLDNPDTALGEIKLGYAAAETSGPYAVAEQSFLDALADNESLAISVMGGQADAERAANSGEIDAALWVALPDGITVYEGDDAIKNRAVNLIAQSFARAYAAEATVYMAEVMKMDSPIKSANDDGVDSSSLRLGQAPIGPAPSAGPGSANDMAGGVPDYSLIENGTADMSRSMLDFYAVAMI
ncbi:MAG: hypothetical protein LBN12_02895, partial [Clostridiales Family XIII bacterium]|nr:hypothetical protein [Clostridiales Family XIII bacterium]